MKFNKNKYRILHLGWSNAALSTDWETSDWRTALQESNLEVVVDSRLRLSLRMLGCIKRSTTSWSKEAIIPLYLALVQPHLEYCVSPQFKKDFKILESI